MDQAPSDDFMGVFSELSPENQDIIYFTMRDMEHLKDNPKDKISYSRGLKMAMKHKGITLAELAKRVDKKLGTWNSFPAIQSLIYRGSPNSHYLPTVMEILDIDEPYLIQNSEYFSSRLDPHDLSKSYNSLSPQNQIAIANLITYLWQRQ